MARHTDLMGLGETPALSRLYATPPTLVTAYGTSSGSANPIAGDQFFTIVTSGTSSLRLPPVGADTGCLLGDRFNIGNITSASVAVYAAATPAGSAVTIYTAAVSTAGTTGVSVGVGSYLEFRPITVSTWLCNYGSA